MKQFRLLDAFCGMGGTSDGFALEGFDVTGIDIVDAPKMLGYKHRFIQADMLTLKGEDFVSDIHGRKERSLRKLLKQLEKNENQYEESKDDYDLCDEMFSYLNGRIAESRAIRIQLEKLFEGQK